MYQTLPNPAVQQLLNDKAAAIPGILSAVIATADGLALYFTSALDQQQADTRAAVVSGLVSLSSSLAAGEGGVRRTLIETEEGNHLLVRAGQRTYLAVTADGQADLQRVGYEVTRLTQQLAMVLDADQRQTAAPDGSRP
jgi:uncharacterized protein